MDDITWLLCRAWLKSFGGIETNKDAIVERGWGPLNCVLIDDPELQDCQNIILERGRSAYRTTIVSSSKVIDLTALNKTEGSDGNSFMMFVEDVKKAIQCEELIQSIKGSSRKKLQRETLPRGNN
jgi:hypothetical protein